MSRARGTDRFVHTVGRGIQEILMVSLTCEGRRENGFGRLRSNPNRLQPMSLEEAVRLVKSLNLVHGITELHEGVAKKDKQIEQPWEKRHIRLAGEFKEEE